jgi:uncharacterized protein YdeI (YjbR/CyaY-like superfamily)
MQSARIECSQTVTAAASELPQLHRTRSNSFSVLHPRTFAPSDAPSHPRTIRTIAPPGDYDIPVPPKFFRTTRDFEQWLAANHRSKTALLVGFHKRGSGLPSITYAEALDAALTYGWIDGVRRRLDERAYTIRFTPRTKGSYWSAVNTKRAKALIKQGRMKPGGLAAFRARDEERTRRLSSERENAAFDSATLRVLKADKTAFAFVEALPPSLKKICIYWVASAKRPETRARRLAHLIERSRAGKRIDLVTPFSRG